MSASILVVLGIALLIAEIFAFTYFLLFLGVGTLFTALLTFLGFFPTASLIWQLFSVALSSLISAVVFKPLFRRFKSKEVYVENAHLNPKEGDFARVAEKGFIEYSGTMWAAETTDFALEEKVKITGKKGDVFLIQKA